MGRREQDCDLIYFTETQIMRANTALTKTFASAFLAANTPTVQIDGRELSWVFFVRTDC